MTKPKPKIDLALQTPAQARTIEVGSAGAKVTVACKMAVAWFEMEICTESKVTEHSQTGPRQITQWDRTGKIFRVRGTAYPTGQVPEGFGPKPEMIAGYALTRDCPKDFWDAWVQQHAKAPYVINGMIMAASSMEALRAEAGERKGLLSGLEPVQRTKDKINDARVTKPVRKDVEAVEQSDLRPS